MSLKQQLKTSVSKVLADLTLSTRGGLQEVKILHKSGKSLHCYFICMSLRSTIVAVG